MSAVLNPYVNFRGQAREAMEFYQSVLGGELQLMTFGDAQMPGVPAEHVMHSQLETPNGFTLMGSDTPEEMPLSNGNSLTICISGDEPVLRDWFAGLAEGGQITVPLTKQSWGAEFGMLVDKFGTPWMVNANIAD